MKTNKVLGYDCIIGAVYIPHEMSDYYHDDIYDFLAADIVFVKVIFDIPIILLGNFNSRTGIATDFENLYEHECCFLEENQFTLYFKQHNIIERANRDKYINKNGKKLIELCKMSDLKIVNGRISKYKYGEYTCQT